MRTLHVAAAIAITALLTTNITAASFDCAKASTKIEHTICNDKHLNALDSEMGKLYKQIKGQSWKNQHRNMVKMRNKDCSKHSDPTNCLTEWFNNEIKELKRQIRLGG